MNNINTKILWTGLIIVAIVILVIVVSPYNFTQFGSSKSVDTLPTSELIPNEESNQLRIEEEEKSTATTDTEESRPAVAVIGKSVNNHDLSAYSFGSGEKEILLIGGIHGGYSWNTTQLMYELIAYLDSIKETLASVRVTIIPLLNPDGYSTLLGTTEKLNSSQIANIPANTVAGRFNGHTVDLNRNFDCQWQADGVWQKQSVSGGEAPFSEPEAMAVKNYIEKYQPTAVIIYYSAAGGVYASSCNNGVSDQSRDLLKQYSQGAGYTSYESYDYYATTGDMTNWLAKINIPAVSVLLTNHIDTELTKNKNGLTAVITALNNEN